VEPFLFWLHWIHVVAGVIWIGTVYFFNFFLTPFLEKTRAEVRVEVFHGLVPLTLAWFRWASLITVLTGGVIYGSWITWVGSAVFFYWPHGLAISVGGLLGIVMFVNGWFVMHPHQEIVIASATRVAQGGQPDPAAPAHSRRVVLASRTNLLLSIPMFFFMAAAGHNPSVTAMSQTASPIWFWIVTLVLIGAIEINALTGMQGVAKKPLDSLAGTLAAGFVLLAAFYVLIEILR
jgi:uncharacterized membrane protein